VHLNAPIISRVHLFYSAWSGLSVDSSSPLPISPRDQISPLYKKATRIIVLNRSFVLVNNRPYIEPAIRISAVNLSRPRWVA
jgi:hypothetical protein